MQIKNIFLLFMVAGFLSMCSGTSPSEKKLNQSTEKTPDQTFTQTSDQNTNQDSSQSSEQSSNQNIDTGTTDTSTQEPTTNSPETAPSEESTSEETISEETPPQETSSVEEPQVTAEQQEATNECTITITDKETARTFLQGEDTPSANTIQGLKTGCAASSTDVEVFLTTFLCFVGIDPTLVTDSDIREDIDNISAIDLSNLQNSCEGEIAAL